MVNYVKHSECATLTIARYIDPKPSFQTIPPHTQPTQSHQTECYDLLCNLVWGSAAVLQTDLQHFKANDVSSMYLIMYTWPDKYVYLYT